jgi:large subunit ribosomal protein L10
VWGFFLSMPATKKIEQVKTIVENLKKAKSVALIQYQGLNAVDTASLRAKIKENGGNMEVTKNSLITIALKEIGIDLPETLTGPTSLTYCYNDEISPLKEIDKVNKEKDLTSFKYGIYENKLLSLEQLKSFLNLPSKSVLYAQLVGGLVNPLQRLVYALKFNQTQLVLTLKAISEK